MKKNIVFVILLSLFLLLIVSDSLNGEQVKVTASEAPLHVRPNHESTVMGMIPQGTVLAVISKTDSWYQVELPPDPSGIVITGYVLQNEVVLVQEQREVQQQPSFQPPPPPPSTPQPEQEPRKRMTTYPAKESLQGQFYASGLLGMAIGFERIKVGEVMYSDGDWKDIIIMPGGGLNLEARLGFYFTSSLRAEFGASYQASGNTYNVSGSSSDFVLSFKRIPLNLTILYDLPKRKKMQLYIGAGPSVSLGPRYTEEFVTKDYINYKTAFGFHALVGMMWNKGKGFYYVELCYMGPFKYDWTDATFYPPSFMRSLSGNGIMINFGGGILFGR